MRLLNQGRIGAWNFVAHGLKACMFALVVLWVLVLTTLCASPLLPNPSTGNTISYNCHGTIVYITPFRHAVLIWLIPVLVLIGLCAKAANKRAKQDSKGGNSESA
jgi:hypothetical protein